MFVTYNGGYWASIITKRDKAALRQRRTYFRNEHGKGLLVANPLWESARESPLRKLSHVETVEEREQESCVTSCVNIHYTSLRLTSR